MMKRNIYFLCIVALLTGLVGCKKFLTVKPATQLTEKDAFSSAEGFQQALNGLYAQAASRNLYGDNLTMGFASVLSQDYLLTASNAPQRDAKNFNYTSSSVMTTANDIWTSAYTLIAGANKIIYYTGVNQSMLGNSNYALYRGEALGMRALLHFDLLRLFGPEYVAGANNKAIPYVTKVSQLPVPAATTKQVMDSVLADLSRAAVLLKNVDPIVKNTRSRKSVMNYYAVKALEARAQLYKGDKAAARAAALEVTSSGRFPFVSSSAAAAAPALRDRLYFPELALMFRVREIANWADNGANTYFRFYTTINDKFTTSGENFTSLYENSSTDLRFLYRVEKDGGFDFPSKYWQTNTPSGGVVNTLDTTRLNQLVPVVRISEMHYILAETAATAAEGFAHLNTVRRVRGLPDLLTTGTATELEAEILKEYRKDLYAEGQLFFYYKRKNARSMQFMSSDIPSLAIYSLPIPLAELEYNPTYK